MNTGPVVVSILLAATFAVASEAEEKEKPKPEEEPETRSVSVDVSISAGVSEIRDGETPTIRRMDSIVGSRLQDDEALLAVVVVAEGETLILQRGFQSGTPRITIACIDRSPRVLMATIGTGRYMLLFDDDAPVKTRVRYMAGEHAVLPEPESVLESMLNSDRLVVQRRRNALFSLDLAGARNDLQEFRQRCAVR